MEQNIIDIIQNNDFLIKINPHILSKTACVLSGLKSLDFNTTYADQGLDELDMVELVMNLESDLDIHIPDEIALVLFSCNSRPINLQSFIRNKKIEELGI